MLAELLAYFDTSPAIRLLRSPNAPFVINFFLQQFKAAGRLAIPATDLLAALAAYQEDLHETYPDAMRDKPETYLSTWCSNDTRWLHRFLEASCPEPLYQLTPHTEDVLTLLDRVLNQDLGFVGTDSRLRLVINTLSDIVVGATDDPQTRLAHLRQEQERIEQEIARIELEGTVPTYQPAQVRERFSTAVSLLKQLQGDFRAVEEKFKQITHQVQQRQNEGRDSRGGILEFALDAEDVLKGEDQGVSFYEFVRFILSPAQQEKLQTIIQQLGQIPALADQTDGLETVRRMVPLLLAEAEKVMRTNQRLSGTLRRLLDARSHGERQRTAQLIREILSLASSQSSDPPLHVGIEIETKADIASPFTRIFWSEPTRLAAVDMCEFTADEQDRQRVFRQLARMQRLDWRGMRGRIADALAEQGSLTLGALVQQFPPAAGVVELLGYLQIAHDDGHLISREAAEEIVLPTGNGRPGTLAIRMPLIHFVIH